MGSELRSTHALRSPRFSLASFDLRARLDSDQSDESSGSDDDFEHVSTMRARYARRASRQTHVGPINTFLRMDGIYKQVQETAQPSLDELEELRKSLQERGITDKLDQEEALLQQYPARRDLVAAGSWEEKEKEFAADLSRCTMEERFVKDVATDHEVDVKLLQLLGPELEASIFSNYGKIDEYFQYKKQIIERNMSHKSAIHRQSVMVTDLDDQMGVAGLSDLTAWHGVAPSRRKSSSSVKNVLLDETPLTRTSSGKSISSKAESYGKSPRRSRSSVEGGDENAFARLYMHSRGMGRMRKSWCRTRRDSSAGASAAAAASAVAAFGRRKSSLSEIEHGSTRVSVPTVPERVSLPDVSHDGRATPVKPETPGSSPKGRFTPVKPETPRSSSTPYSRRGSKSSVADQMVGG